MKIGFALAVVLCIAAATLPGFEAKQTTRAARKLKFSESADSTTEGHLMAKDPAERKGRDLKWGGYHPSGYGSYSHSHYSKPKHSYYSKSSTYSKPSGYKHGDDDDDKKTYGYGYKYSSDDDDDDKKKHGYGYGYSSDDDDDDKKKHGYGYSYGYGKKDDDGYH